MVGEIVGGLGTQIHGGAIIVGSVGDEDKGMAEHGHMFCSGR